MDTEEFLLPRSRMANERLHAMIPGGAHTYAKGDDQYPEDLAPVISHGRGAHVWDVDGNRSSSTAPACGRSASATPTRA